MIFRFILLFGLTMLLWGKALAQPNLTCEPELQISTEFSNGARWDFCWESRVRENVVVKELQYTTPAGDTQSVMSSMRLAQLHVAYDDNNVTYNDITEYGLGGLYMTVLTAEDCPGGDIISVNDRPGICLTRSSDKDSYRTASRSVKAESVNLFSISQVGAYAYIVGWTFYDNGAIEPSVGATGALQRSSTQTDSPYGRPLSGNDATVWLSHTHNYYWRLDFDLGNSATDDTVTEIKYPLAEDGTRSARPRLLRSEEAMRIDPTNYQNWTIWNSEPTHLLQPGETTAQPAWGYQIEPIRFGHRLVREANEPYTGYDFFITVVNDCERFASQNTLFNPECSDDVLQFANDEPLAEQDLVAWHRVSFHHTPRNEDQRNMHSHWDGFVIEPVNLLPNSASYDNNADQPPIFTDLTDLSNTTADEIDITLQANDPEGKALIYNAEGLPDGVAISDQGRLTGSPTSTGHFHVTVYASDGVETGAAMFDWDISSGGTVGNKSAFGPIAPISAAGLALLLLVRRRVLRHS